MKEVYNSFFENITIKTLTCSFNQCGLKWGSKSSKYNFYKLYYYISGESELIIDGFDLAPKCGDLVLIPANIVHSYTQNSKNRVVQYWCHFDLSLSSGMKILNAITCNISRDIVEPLFNKLLVSWNENSTLSGLAEKSALLDLLYLLFSNVDYTKTLFVDSKDDNILIHNYIINNLQNNITLNELANLIPMHPNYFIRYFKKHFETTPIDYINTLRLRKSLTLLESERKMSIAQIASIVGFNDYRYFTKLFKKKYTIPPSVYREIMINKVVI